VKLIGAHILIAGLISFITVLLLGPGTIRILHRLKFGQSIRTDGPQSHQKKSGTPTMGGILIYLGIIAGVLAGAWGKMNSDLIWLLGITLGFGAIGLVDDMIIIIAKRSLGLKARQKLLAQVILAGIFGMYVIHVNALPSLLIPFSSINIPMTNAILTFLFVVFTIVSETNAVNLTDGLDGLAAGTSVIAAVAFGVLAIATNHPQMAVFCFALAGACLGFAWFNSPPAQVFMGDTGSLGLGAAFAAAATLIQTPLYLLVIGGIFLAEALSVAIQVISFKLTGKRVFRMSPLHHHFELGGWMESKVVFRFWIAGIFLAVIGVAGFYLSRS
jgi:phospho-N-acetylmuramoyl-pentapeptide-transferase